MIQSLDYFCIKSNSALPKFLIIRFSSIGDIVLTTPVIRCLKKQVPDAELHFLTRSSFREVLSGNPYIDKLHLLNDSLSEVLPQLKKIKFDGIIDLHHNQRSWFVKRNLKAPSHSFYKLNIEKWLMVNFKINRLPDKHIVDRYLDSVSHLAVKNDGEGLDFFISPDALKINETLPISHQEFIAFVIGAKHATKRLPVEKIIALCKQIDKPIVLLGGKEDAERANKIVDALGKKIYSACGKTNLHESAALLKYSTHVITHDTGLMHIAAALGKKIISVWGNTIPQFGMYPYFKDINGGTQSGMNSVVEVKNLRCRPCSKIGFEKCPKGHLNCLNKISDSEILERLAIK